MKTMIKSKAALVAVTMVATSAPTFAQDKLSDKYCLFAAAQKLPAIPGLTVEGGRIKPHLRTAKRF